MEKFYNVYVCVSEWGDYMDTTGNDLISLINENMDHTEWTMSNHDLKTIRSDDREISDVGIDDNHLYANGEQNYKVKATAEAVEKFERYIDDYSETTIEVTELTDAELADVVYAELEGA